MLAQGRAPGGLEPTDRPSLVLSGAGCRIDRSLGAGSQGEVFSVDVDAPNLSGRYALKWYWPHMASAEQRRALEELIEIGRPHHRFLWPIDLVELPGRVGFGYLMDLRPPEYRGIIELVKGTPPWSAEVLVTVGEQLADSFLRLHSLGLCYRDINFGNVFYHPRSGEVLICDNDNVGIDGSEGQVLGTLEFMAPEIVRNEALPDSLTDRHSLAVLLFWMSIRHHPLMGARELEYPSLDREAKVALFGHRALFMYDPDDDSNRPDPTEHRNAVALWQMYPGFVRRRFTTAFGPGLRNRHDREMEGMWRGTMRRLADTIFTCPGCPARLFAELPARPEDPAATVRCYHHDEAVRPRFVFFLGRDVYNKHRSMAASLGTVLTDEHVASSHGAIVENAAREVGRVEAHPGNAAIWGLRNSSHETWIVHRPSGETVTVAPGETARLEHQSRIRIAAREVVVAATG